MRRDYLHGSIGIVIGIVIGIGTYRRLIIKRISKIKIFIPNGR